MTTHIDEARDEMEKTFQCVTGYACADHVRKAIAALSAHEEEVKELIQALRECVDVLSFIEERTAIRTNPPTLDKARAILAKVKP